MFEQIHIISIRVKDMIAGLAVDELSAGSVLEEDTPLFVQTDAKPIFDSFSAVMLFIQLENEFDFHINDDDMNLENFNTIRLISSYITSHIGSSPLNQTV